MKRFKPKRPMEPRAPGAVLDGNHNPSVCFVKWAKYGKGCERCTWPDERDRGPFSPHEQAKRADSMVGRRGVVLTYVKEVNSYVAHVPPVEGVNEHPDWGDGQSQVMEDEN